jgi:hypothetical protein
MPQAPRATRRPRLRLAFALWVRAAVVAGSALVAGGARAQSVSASAPGVAVILTPARPYMLLGTDTEMAIDVTVTGPAAVAFVPTRALTTVGTLEMPTPVAAPGPPAGAKPEAAVPSSAKAPTDDGAAAAAAPSGDPSSSTRRFTARYVAPTDRFPQVALIVVELTNGTAVARGVLSVPLHGSTDVPLRTNPAAAVTLRVGERTFGPVTADRLGHVKIPVEVPPGIRVGVARAVDRAGNLRETDVDLQPAAFRRVLIVAPDSLEVGSFVEVTVVAVDAEGAPVPAPRISLRASDGLVHPLGGGALGEARFLVEAPRRAGGGALALTAFAAGTPVSRSDLAVPLNAGRPEALALSPSTRRLVVGSATNLRVIISAHDQFGNPTSAEGAVALIDGQPVPIELTPGGQGSVVVPAPARYIGLEHLIVHVSLGDARAEQEIAITGGPPTRLTLEVRDPRLVADGQRSTELRVRAVDRYGTPTMVPGISWETPGGRIRRVRVPHEGEYVADFVPARASEPHRQALAVMASQALRAEATLEVAPPPVRALASARVGLFSNFGHAVGPAAFVEAMLPVSVRGVAFTAGLAFGYLRDDISTSASPSGADVAAHVVADQMPLLALARYRLPGLARPEVSFDAAAGLTLARTRLMASPGPGAFDVEAGAVAAALLGGAEAAFPLRPGRVVLGLRYLWSSLGRTSHGDDLQGNSAGLVGDLGYRLSF